MKKYIGTKVLWAEPALRIEDPWGKKTVETLASNPVVQPGSKTTEGYKVRYKDGYESFSPKKVFEESYHEIPAPRPGQQKAMLSQPMAGKTQEEIVAARELAVMTLEAAGYHVVNTLFTDDWYKKEAMKERGVEQIPLQFLAKSLENMSLCHCAYFCKGWEEARGCRIEHQAAIEYGLDIIYEEQGERIMNEKEFVELVRKSVADYVNRRLDKTDNVRITEDQVFIVWMCKALQNSKAMASTTLFDGMYYELTYNGDKQELYLDAYKKWENQCLKLGCIEAIPEGSTCPPNRLDI